MSIIPSAEDRFHQNVLGLAELIRDIVSDVQEKGFPVVSIQIIEFAISLLRHFPSKDVIETFINKANGSTTTFETHPFTKIFHKDRDFFLNNMDLLFGDLPPDRVKMFGAMFSEKDKQGNPIVPEEDEEEIWEYFQSLVKIAIKYVHEERQPLLVQEEHQEIRKYRNASLFPNFELAKHVELWEVMLSFPSS